MSMIPPLRLDVQFVNPLCFYCLLLQADRVNLPLDLDSDDSTHFPGQRPRLPENLMSLQRGMQALLDGWASAKVQIVF